MKKKSKGSNISKSPPLQPQPQQIKDKLQSIQNSIIQKLQDNTLTIQETQIPYLSSKSKAQRDSKQELSFSQLVDKRRRIQQELQRIHYEQKQMLSNSRSRVAISMQASQYTHQEKVRVNKLRKRLEDFDRILEEKNREMEEKKVRDLKEQEERERREKEIANEVKKARIEERLRELQDRKQQRKLIRKQTDLYVKQVQHSQKKYQMMNQQWRERNKQQQQKKYELMQMRKKQKQVDFARLREHQKRYQQILQTKKKQLQQRRLSSTRQLLENSRSMSLPKTRYHIILQQEHQEQKQQQQRKRDLHRFLLQKQQQYSQYIREQFLPPKKDQAQTTVLTAPQQRITRRTQQEIREIGNLNLALGNRKAKKKSTLNTTSGEESCKSLSRVNLYHDYLQDLHKKREEQGDRFSRSQPVDVKKKTQDILNDSTMKSQQKVEMIKVLANKYDNGGNLIEAIQNKLSILASLN